MLSKLSSFCYPRLTFFTIIFPNSFRKTVRVSNGLDPDSGLHITGPDMGLSWLSSFAANRQRVNKDTLGCTDEFVLFFLYLLFLFVRKLTHVYRDSEIPETRMVKLRYIMTVYSSSSNWKDFCAIQNDYIYSLFLRCGLW